MAEQDMEGSDWLAEIRRNIDDLYTKTLTTAPASDAQAIAKVVSDKAVTPANLAALGSSETFAGLVELATSAETITGTDAVRAVTPQGLAARTALSSRTGLVQLASAAEAIAGSDTAKALTAADLAAVIAGLDIITFTGHNNTGACTLTGVKVGDVVLSVTGIASADKGDQSASFEAAITVNDQIQQSSVSDLSTKVYMAYILRKS